MICPYCDQQMEVGSFQSGHGIVWLPKTKRLFAYSPLFPPKGSVVLSDLDMLKCSAVTAYLCKTCKKVIVDYAGPDPNFSE